MATPSSGKDVAKSDPKDVVTNPRGIPQAPFVDKVEDYVTSREDVEPTLRRFQEMISKYQFMEQNLQRRVAGLDEKLPDIQKTLDTVRFLQTRRPGGSGAKKDDDDDDLDSDHDEDDNEEGEAIETTFELNDTLYAKASIPPTDEVHLWLGANVMLTYPIDEAEELLAQKLNSAQTSRRNCEEDLEFLREQITTMEVAIARVYNWDVVQKRKDKKEDEATKGSSSKGGADEPDG
ncbi:peptide chain release factor 1 [Sporothrix bragantina]|uniref:Prefoldin subunit 3 n=1 Tax=Sporothrix bragantina TaxID=671064 RepID=A0ABP0BRY4_9PEZI